MIEATGPIRRIAVSTGGGDAPGLNAVIRAVVRAGLDEGWEVWGIRDSYGGLMDPSRAQLLTRDSVAGITHLGGTILGTTNHGDPFNWPVELADGTVITEDRSATVIENFKLLSLDALISIGGDGSLAIAQKFFELGLPVIGVPKTIDNDLSCTDVTFGFDTAVQNATDALDKLHPTAEAHRRCIVVEVMGRYAGWIALQAGFAGTADVILIPEIPFDVDKVCEKVRQRDALGRGFCIVVVAEGARPIGGELTIREKLVGRELRLGGIAHELTAAIQERTRKESRSLILGHLQRGGNPTTFDRTLGLRFGGAAVRAVKRRDFGKMVALRGTDIVTASIKEAINTHKSVPLDHDIIQTARAMGVCFGD